MTMTVNEHIRIKKEFDRLSINLEKALDRIEELERKMCRIENWALRFSEDD